MIIYYYYSCYAVLFLFPFFNATMSVVFVGTNSFVKIIQILFFYSKRKRKREKCCNNRTKNEEEKGKRKMSTVSIPIQSQQNHNNIENSEAASASSFSNHHTSSVLSAEALAIAASSSSENNKNKNNKNKNNKSTNSIETDTNNNTSSMYHYKKITEQELDAELAEHLAAKKRRGTYKAKYLIWLAGTIFGACGVCLICAQNAGVADYYFYSPENYVAHQRANESGVDFNVIHPGAVKAKDLDDATFTLYMDGYICANGNCTSIFDHKCEECCDEMHLRLVEFRGLNIMSGTIELLFCFLMFGVLFVRFVSQLGKELIGANAAKKSVFERIDVWIQEVMQSKRTVCVLFTGTSILMTMLIAASIYLIYENYAILHTPLCEDQPQSFPFNYSLSELDEGHYSPGRGTHLVLIGSIGALAVALLFFIWLVMYICCAMKEMNEDEEAGFDDHLIDVSDIDDLLNSDLYKKDPDYRRYVEEAKKTIQSSDLKAQQAQREELRRKARDARKYSVISNNNNRKRNDSNASGVSLNILGRLRGWSSAPTQNNNNTNAGSDGSNSSMATYRNMSSKSVPGDSGVNPEHTQPILSPANLERVNKGGLSLLDDGYFEQNYAVERKDDKNSVVGGENNNKQNYSSAFSAPPAIRQHQQPAMTPKNSSNHSPSNQSFMTNNTSHHQQHQHQHHHTPSSADDHHQDNQHQHQQQLLPEDSVSNVGIPVAANNNNKKKKLVTVRKPIRKKSAAAASGEKNEDNNNNDNNDDDENGESSPKHLRDTLPPQ